MAAQNTLLVDYILTFSSSHLALKAESLLNQADITSRLIAAPRSISSECGFCLLLENIESDHMVERLKGLSVGYAGIYTKQQNDGVTQYEQQA